MPAGLRAGQQANGWWDGIFAGRPRPPDIPEEAAGAGFDPMVRLDHTRAGHRHRAGDLPPDRGGRTVAGSVVADNPDGGASLWFELPA